MRRAYPVAAVLAALALPACASSSSTSGPVAVTGTETITGYVSGQPALVNAPVIPLTLAGPVDATSTISLGGNGPKKGQLHTFRTGTGNLVVRITAAPANTQKLLSAKTCQFEYTTVVTYEVAGTKSTGAFKGATGHGTARVVFAADLPKFGTGKHKGTCNESNNAQPAASTATTTFRASGPLTVRKG